MHELRPTVHNASHTVNTCAHRAVLAHLGQPEVHQLRLAVKQHDVVGLEVAVSIPAKVLRFSMQEGKCTYGSGVLESGRLECMKSSALQMPLMMCSFCPSLREATACRLCG